MVLLVSCKFLVVIYMHIILKLSAAYRNCVGVVHDSADEWLCEDCRPHKYFELQMMT